jgi:hypothetical protein
MTRRVVLMILDGLRRDGATPDLMPALGAFCGEAATFPEHRSVFPSCTRVVSSCVATGRTPAGHGVQGNALALAELGGLAVRDVGPPGFFEHRRAVTGRAMDAPTWAERVAGAGGAVVFSNVSPGAAYAQDPDGHGRVYHRAGSYGPGRRPLEAPEALSVTLDAAGDAAMVARFCDEVVLGRRPALGVLWCGEPDHAQHNLALGSAAHRAALAEADRNVARVRAAVAAAEAGGDDILLMIGSDHGHDTVTGSVDVTAALIAAGLKDGPESREVVVAPNGSAALVYVAPAAEGRIPALRAFLAEQPWTGRLFDRDALGEIGHAPAHGLAFAISMAGDEAPNAHGAPGRTLVCAPLGGKPDRMGFGQHGGLGRWAQAPVLAIRGRGFAPGPRPDRASSAIDLAPTAMRHLGLPESGMDGAPLQDA